MASTTGRVNCIASSCVMEWATVGDDPNYLRLPIGDRIISLGPGRSGGSAATDQEVPSTEDTDREFLAGSVSSGGITGEGGNERRLGVEEGKVSWDVSVIDREEHRGVAHGGA